MSATLTTEACPSCRTAVESAVYNAEFAGNLLTLLLPVLGLIVFGVVVYFKDEHPYDVE